MEQSVLVEAWIEQENKLVTIQLDKEKLPNDI